MPFVSGLPETACGVGSTLARTESVRAALPSLFREFGISSVLDAPCGDCNWISTVDLSGVEYIGCDFDEEHLKVARQKMPGREFLLRDLVADALPAADLMICREFMQHICDAEITAVLKNFADSGARWMLATCYRNEENADLVRGFRPVNLMRPPWNFGVPRIVPDADEHFLGLWNLRA